VQGNGPLPLAFRFKADPDAFGIDRVASATFRVGGPERWPLFSLMDADTAGLDGLMSFAGAPAVAGIPTRLFAWENLTRMIISDNQLPAENEVDDLIPGMESVSVVEDGSPVTALQPTSLALFGVGFLIALGITLSHVGE
jgi:hypothetical protein